MTAIHNSLITNTGSQPKIEPAPGTAKIIHPDDDISLVSVKSHFRVFSNISSGRISCFFAEIQTSDDAPANPDATNAPRSFDDKFHATYNSNLY